MFDGITNGIRGALSFLDRNKLSEGNIREGMQQVRQSLLEADVHFDVVEDFVERITEQAVGLEGLKTVKPSQYVVKIVYDELVRLMGGDPEADRVMNKSIASTLGIKRGGITVIMMCGLQGSGKTTTCGKLSKKLLSQGYKPMLVAADLQRPAAIEQLKIVGEQVGVPVYTEEPGKSSPVQVCRNGLKAAKAAGDVRVLILDTAGRLHVDAALMQELQQIDKNCNPDQALLVCDAMTGQDAVNSAKAFNDALAIDGVILTKLDGDTRGGAALSIKSVADVPIKFTGVGEQLDKLEDFHPDRMAERILGMGDVLSLIEMAQDKLDEEELAKAQAAMEKGRFTLEMFQQQMKQIKKMGPMKGIMKMMGLGDAIAQMDDMNPEEDLRKIDGIINSMTKQEKRTPDIIDRSRRARIAAGSGNDPADVNKLLKDFKGMSGMMKEMAGIKNPLKKIQAMKQLAQQGMLDEGAQVRKEKASTKSQPRDMKAQKNKKKNKRKEAKKQRKKNRR